MTKDDRLDFSAPRRNADAILDVLKPLFGTAPRDVLEIAAGSGQHAIHIAAACPTVTWWPTDLNPEHIRSIDAWRTEAGVNAVQPARLLDVTEESWRRGDHFDDWPAHYDAVVNMNLIQVAPWEAVEGVIEGASRRLKDTGFMYFYGPFKRDGRLTSEGDRAFDEDLQARNPTWGVKDASEVAACAERFGLILEQTIAMPANNLSLIFRRGAIKGPQFG